MKKSNQIPKDIICLVMFLRLVSRRLNKVLEQEYGVQATNNQKLEPPGLIKAWKMKGNEITVWFARSYGSNEWVKKVTATVVHSLDHFWGNDEDSKKFFRRAFFNVMITGNPLKIVDNNLVNNNQTDVIYEMNEASYDRLGLLSPQGYIANKAPIGFYCYEAVRIDDKPFGNRLIRELTEHLCNANELGIEKGEFLSDNGIKYYQVIRWTSDAYQTKEFLDNHFLGYTPCIIPPQDDPLNEDDEKLLKSFCEKRFRSICGVWSYSTPGPHQSNDVSNEECQSSISAKKDEFLKNGTLPSRAGKKYSEVFCYEISMLVDCDTLNENPVDLMSLRDQLCNTWLYPWADHSWNNTQLARGLEKFHEPV